MMHHHTKAGLQKVQQLRGYGPDKNSVKVLTFAVTLTFSTPPQCIFFTRQPSFWCCAFKSKFGCKRINSSEDRAESHILIIWVFTVTLNFKTTKQLAWHSDSWWCITIPSLASNSSAVQKILSGQTLIDILKFYCDCDPEQSKSVFSQDTRSNQVWLQTDQKFRTYSRNSNILIMYTSTVTLTLKIANQFFCMTLKLIVNHHAQFGYKRLIGSGNIIQTKSGQTDTQDAVTAVYTTHPSFVTGGITREDGE